MHLKLALFIYFSTRSLAYESDTCASDNYTSLTALLFIYFSSRSLVYESATCASNSCTLPTVLLDL